MLNKSTSQLEILTTLLQSEGIPYWIDFGTLLGFVREGKIIQKKEGFDDIDLSTSSDHIDKLFELEGKLIEIGYFPRYLTFGTHLLMLKLFPLRIEEGSVAVDIHVYRKKQENALLALPFIKNPYPRWSPQGVGFRFLSVVYNFILKKTTNGPVPCPKNLPTSFPFARLYTYAIISVPISVIEPLTSLPVFNLSTPRNSEHVLQSRYGDWRVKKEEWNWTSDQLDIIQRLSSRDLHTFLEGFSI